MAASDGPREAPAALREAFDMALGQPDPLIALGAARALRAHLTNWESRLAGEAIAAGATWEMVGEAMGATRQAAWDRFHHAATSREGVASPRSRYESELRRLDDELRRLKLKSKATRALSRKSSKEPGRPADG